MWKLIVAFALTGWAGIVDIAYRLAGARIPLCGSPIDTGSVNCIVRATAARDYVLIVGMTVGLVAVIAALAFFATQRARRSGSFTGWKPTSPELRPLPRS